MNALKKTSAALIAFAISASAFAGTDLETRVHELEKKIDMMSTTTSSDTFGPKLALARPEPNGKGWFLTFDVLYWQTKVGGVQYASAVSPEVASPIARSSTPREPEFDWTFAFKAGIGYKFFHDGWDAHFEYTYFRNDASDSYSTTLPTVIEPAIPELFGLTGTTVADLLGGSGLSTFATQTSANFRVNFNDINLDLGRDFFVSQNLSLRPSMGLKASWLSFRQNVTLSGGGTAYEYTVFNLIPLKEKGLGANTIYAEAHQKFVGIGPRASVDTRWHLGNDISFYGDVAGALLFGYFRTDGEATYTGNTANYFTAQDKFHRVIPTVDFELGLIYDKYVMCDTQHFSISLGYETQYFWDVNYLSTSKAPQGLAMYGINLDIRWDF